MKIFLKICRSLLVAPFIIYLYNLIASPLNLVVPINLFSIVVVAFLGMSGLVTILLLLICV